jgi:hypothetical protein
VRRKSIGDNSQSQKTNRLIIPAQPRNKINSKRNNKNLKRQNKLHKTIGEDGKIK